MHDILESPFRRGGEVHEPLSPATLEYVPIRERPEEERPREKLLSRGPGSLTNAELLGLVFGCGTRVDGRSVSAIELGQTLLRSFGSITALAQRDAVQLAHTVKGIGPAKAAQVAAVFEIGRRVECAPPEERIQIRRPADVAASLGPRLRDLPREEFVVLHLNAASVVLSEYWLTTGGLTASIVEPRQVFGRAILENAASVICVHNHPSGNPEPSREDVAITKQLVEAGKILGIDVRDHVIIAGRTFTSLADRGLI